MDDAGDTTTHKALRVVLNEKTNEAIKQMQKDSEELASLKKQLPILALGQRDIDNHQTGQYLEEISHLNYKHYLFQEKISHGTEDVDYKWRLDDGTEEHVSLEEMVERGFRHNPCSRYGCDGQREMCPFSHVIDVRLDPLDVCGLHYLANGFHCWDDDDSWDEDEDDMHFGFDLIWKREPSNYRDDGVLKEVQCKRCGKVLEEAEIIDHIYDYKNPIWKCPHVTN